MVGIWRKSYAGPTVAIKSSGSWKRKIYMNNLINKNNSLGKVSIQEKDRKKKFKC